MGLIDDTLKYFDTRDLYEVLKIKKNARGEDVKKAYRKQSLQFHPDRHANAEPDKLADITAKFQVLSKVNYVLSDEEKRKLYDDAGIIASDDTLESEADWEAYWRLLFPKVTTKDIDSFMTKYAGSEDEKKDLISVYNKYGGNMDKISEGMIGFDEVRHRDMILQLISSGELEELDEFKKDTDAKRKKRQGKVEREARASEKASSKRKKAQPSDDDLVNAITSRAKGNFDSMISGLEAKYGGKKDSPKRAKTTARKCRK
ncbi:DnaJ -like protein subfamily C member 9 [Halotydeus destructor]|nr:DnaJ -like protein subfamily C member 9 [Halotydeus destructor]